MYYRDTHIGEGEFRMKPFSSLEAAMTNEQSEGPIYEVVAVHTPQTVRSVEWIEERLDPVGHG